MPAGGHHLGVLVVGQEIGADGAALVAHLHVALGAGQLGLVVLADGVGFQIEGLLVQAIGAGGGRRSRRRRRRDLGQGRRWMHAREGRRSPEGDQRDSQRQGELQPRRRGRPASARRGPAITNQGGSFAIGLELGGGSVLAGFPKPHNWPSARRRRLMQSDSGNQFKYLH